MPSTYAHYLFGQEVYRELPAQLQTIIDHHRSLYHIGLHGPDILFYYHPMIPLPANRLGYRIHHKSGSRFFRHGLSVLRELQDPEAGLAYLFGFICHFVLDSECHTYINDCIAHSNRTHTAMETDLDRFLLQMHGLDPLNDCLTTHIRPTGDDIAIIASFFPHVSVRQVTKALSLMIHYNRLLQAASRHKRRMILFLFRLSGNYRRLHGLLMPEHPRVGYEDCTLALTALLYDSVPTACRLIVNYYHAYEEIDVLTKRFQSPFC